RAAGASALLAVPGGVRATAVAHRTREDRGGIGQAGHNDAWGASTPARRRNAMRSGWVHVFIAAAALTATIGAQEPQAPPAAPAPAPAAQAPAPPLPISPAPIQPT